MKYEKTDVVVFGGGTAGVVAALQAARAGSQTLLVEMNSALGGSMTVGRVNYPAYFYSPEKQIIAGIGWELVCKAKKLDNSPFPDFSIQNPERPSYSVGVNPYLYALVCEEECLKAGVKIHYQEIPLSVEDTGNEWKIETAAKGIQRTIRAKEIIDCTGDADIVGMLNLPRIREENERQPGTLSFRLAGYNPDELDEDEIEDAYQKARASGALQEGDFCYANKPFLTFLKGYGSNMQHTFGADSSNADSQTSANIEGRKALLRLLHFIHTLKGCENATVKWMSQQTTSRDTYRIQGETVITHEDYMTARQFEDALCYTLYFIDVHCREGMHHEFIEGNQIPTIPFGALIPAGSKRILSAGRTVSSDTKAHSALRVEASCMAMGQAAGAAAALGCQKQCPSRNVPIEEIRALLKEHNAIVPGFEE